MVSLHRWATMGALAHVMGLTCSPTITMRGHAVSGKLSPDSDAAQCLKVRLERGKSGGTPSCRRARCGVIRPASCPAPQLLARQPCALNQRLDFCPHDLRMHRAKYVTCAKPQSVLAMTFSRPTS